MAAEIKQTTVSNFLLENAMSAAQQVMAEQVHFLLSPSKWRAFHAALDAPPKKNTALKKLLMTKGVLDES